MAKESRKARTIRYLREARELLSRRGAWTKGRYTNSYGDETCFCAMGALNKAVTGRASSYDLKQFDEAGVDATRLLSEQLPERVRDRVSDDGWGSQVIEFNDTRSRRKKDVLGIFDQAIEAAEKS